MPDDFDRFVYPGLDFAVPADPAKYEARLIEAFPDEAQAIGRYFRDIRQSMRWMVLGFMQGMVPGPVVPLLRLIRKLMTSDSVRSTKAYLDKHFRSPQLRALLVSHWGDYGLPPGRSAFAIHAMITHHYFKGAWFPEGGAGRIGRTFETGIERCGGSVRVAQEAVEILTEGGRAVGVRVIDHRGPVAVERFYKAPIIISNAGAETTFNTLLPVTGQIGAATAAVRAEIDRLGSGISAVTLYLRLKADPRSLGVKGENYWISTDLDPDDIEGQTTDLLAGKPRNAFVSFPSIKSGDDRFHTAEILTPLDPTVLDGWRDRTKGARGEDYSALKARMGEGMLRLAETVIPGLSDLVVYSELSTPLSVVHYTSHPRGAFYGLPGTPERYRSTLFGPRTPIPGLFLSGQDAGCLGIVGAMMGGVGAACQALGARGFPMIQAALKQSVLRRARPSVGFSKELPPEKRWAEIFAKKRLTPDIWEVTFRVEGDPIAFAPGQFARLHVGQGEWRDYSIAGMEGDGVRFLISTRTGGYGSQFIEAAPLGTRTEIELPLGNYALVDTPHQKSSSPLERAYPPSFQCFSSLSTQVSWIRRICCSVAEPALRTSPRICRTCRLTRFVATARTRHLQVGGTVGLPRGSSISTKIP